MGLTSEWSPVNALGERGRKNEKRFQERRGSNVARVGSEHAFPIRIRLDSDEQRRQAGAHTVGRPFSCNVLFSFRCSAYQ